MSESGSGGKLKSVSFTIDSIRGGEEEGVVEHTLLNDPSIKTEVSICTVTPEAGTSAASTPSGDVSSENVKDMKRKLSSDAPMEEDKAIQKKKQLTDEAQTNHPPNLRFKKIRTVHCDDCGEDVPIDEWPNHRDRLRKVEITEKLSSFKKFLVALVIDTFMWILVNVFFREVSVVGLENIPPDGPVVFYGNHQNQFIDAMMIRAHCGRPVRFIIAEKSLTRPIIGHFARLMDSVPVVRPQDVGQANGAGKISKMDMNDVIGDGSTNFKKELSHGDVIFWVVPNKKELCSGQVIQIVSDNHLKLSMNLQEEDKVVTPTSFKYSRRIDHSEMYANVYHTMEKGECIGIFPEGGSHDRTSLQPLKAGVALFSLGAYERGIVPKIIPCGLTYFYGHKFRSRAHIEFGEPLRPTEDMVMEFADQKQKRKATGEFIKVLDLALRSVTINVADWSTLKFLHAFRRLYQPPECVLETKDYLKLTRRLSLMIQERDSEPRFADFRNKVDNYCDYCSALLVRDSQVVTLDKISEANWSLLMRRLVMLTVLGVILIPFFLISLPIGVITNVLAEAHARSALSASTVKVVAADVKGSYKIVVGFVLCPLEMILAAVIVYGFTDIRTALTVYFSLPMAMYVSLLILQEFVMEGRAALPLVMSLFSKHKQFKKLHEKRTVLVDLAKQIVKMYDVALEEELSAFKVVKEGCGLRQPSLFSLRHTSRTKQA